MIYRIFYRCRNCGTKFFKDEDADNFNDEELIEMFSKCPGEIHTCEVDVTGYGVVAGFMKMKKPSVVQR